MEKQNQDLIQNNSSCLCKKCISWALKTVHLEFGLKAEEVQVQEQLWKAQDIRKQM